MHAQHWPRLHPLHGRACVNFAIRKAGRHQFRVPTDSQGRRIGGERLGGLEGVEEPGEPGRAALLYDYCTALSY